MFLLPSMNIHTISIQKKDIHKQLLVIKALYVTGVEIYSYKTYSCSGVVDLLLVYFSFRVKRPLTYISIFFSSMVQTHNNVLGTDQQCLSRHPHIL